MTGNVDANDAARRDRFVDAVLNGGDGGIGATLLRSAVLAPLAMVHQIGLEAYLLPYRTGIRKRYRLPVPVIAIGNLSSGGTGKTPMAERIAAHLRGGGLRVVLLSRGHGGSSETGRTPRIVSDGTRVLLTAEEAGDEPVLLANRLSGVPVVIGRDRRASGRLAVERFAPDVVLLDDALQYWQLHRDLDIVLLDAARPFDNGHVLPRGLLREAPRRLARAGVVVLTRSDRPTSEVLATGVVRVRRLAPDADVFTARHEPIGWSESAGTSAVEPLGSLRSVTALAFSGIADGAAFRRTIEELRLGIVGTREYGDHHRYSVQDIEDLVVAATRDAAVVVTTEKDLVKVRDLWPADAPPLKALRIQMRIDDDSRFWERVERIAERGNSEQVP